MNDNTMRDEKAILVPNIYTEQEYTNESLEDAWKRINSEEIKNNKFSLFTSISELLDEEEEDVEWIVEGLIRKNGFSILTAKPKVGKSTFARQLCLAISQGDNFLGFKTIKCPVLYISLEEIRDEIRKHFRLMGATGKEELYVITDQIPDNAYDWLKEEIRNKKPSFVVIDPLFKFAKVSDVNDYAKTIRALEPVLQIARTCNVHIMALHHARKGIGEGSDVTLGSTAIFGSVDISILLKKDRNNNSTRIIETEPRYGMEIEPTILNFDSHTRTLSIGVTKDKDSLQRMKDKILNLLNLSQSEMFESDIENNVDGRTLHLRNALRELYSNSQILRSGTGRKGDPYKYYSKTFLTITTENDKVIA